MIKTNPSKLRNINKAYNCLNVFTLFSQCNLLCFYYLCDVMYIYKFLVILMMCFDNKNVYKYLKSSGLYFYLSILDIKYRYNIVMFYLLNNLTMILSWMLNIVANLQ